MRKWLERFAIAGLIGTVLLGTLGLAFAGSGSISVSLNSSSKTGLVVDASGSTGLVAEVTVADDQKMIITDSPTGASTGALDNATWAFTTIEYEHHEIHAGNHFFTELVDTDLDTDETNDVLIITSDTTTWAHMLFGGSAAGAATLYLYEDVVATNNGTDLTIFNSDRNSASASTLQCTYAPVVTNTGTLLKTFYLAAGNKNNSPGAQNRSTLERILKQNTYYLLRMVTTADNNSTLQELIWYEHVNK